MKDNLEAVPEGEITLAEIKQNMQAFRLVQEYADTHIQKDSKLYSALQLVLMRASEAIIDVVDEKGLDIIQLEQAFANNPIMTFFTKGE